MSPGFWFVFLITPKLSPFPLPDIVRINHHDGQLLAVGKLNRADHCVAGRDLLTGQIRGQPVWSGCLWTMDRANLAVALLRKGQIDGIWLDFIDLFKTIFAFHHRHAHAYEKPPSATVTLASDSFSLANVRLRNSRDSAGSIVLVTTLSIIRPPEPGSLHIETM